jgi:hypothetical protein
MSTFTSSSLMTRRRLGGDRTRRGHVARFGVAAGMSVALAVGGGLASGCNNAGEGAASGAALGALVGMGLGSLSGDMGKGAAAGALIGGAGGAVLGDQNQRRERQSRANQPRYHDPYGYHDQHGRRY